MIQILRKILSWIPFLGKTFEVEVIIEESEKTKPSDHESQDDQEFYLANLKSESLENLLNALDEPFEI